MYSILSAKGLNHNEYGLYLNNTCTHTHTQSKVYSFIYSFITLNEQWLDGSSLFFLKFNFVAVQINNCCFSFSFYCCYSLHLTNKHTRSYRRTYSHMAFCCCMRQTCNIDEKFLCCHFTIDFLSNPEF